MHSTLKYGRFFVILALLVITKVFFHIGILELFLQKWYQPQIAFSNNLIIVMKNLFLIYLLSIKERFVILLDNKILMIN